MKGHNLASILIATMLALGVTAGVPVFAHQEHTDFITNAEFIKGHLEQAVANKEAGNTELAIAHAGHPIQEVFVLIEGPLEEASPQRAADLKEALEALPNSVQSDSVQAFSQKVTDVTGMLDEAVQLLVGEEAEELTTKVGVITGLLETAGVEYSEAVENGQITEMVEYQDASAFIGRASAVFGTIESEINTHEAEEIDEFFGQLDASLEARADPEDVQTLIDGIIHEFEEVVPSGNENVEFAANLEYIRGHLAQAVANKQSGNSELAIAHAGHPVSEVYALIEGELAEHNADLNQELKGALTDLANQINGMSVQQVQTEVAQINSLLDAAETSAIGQAERDDPAFNAMVAIAVLETAEHEYEEGVEGGNIVEMIEYQDSTAFIARAEAIFTSIQAEMPEEEAEEVAGFFEQLDSLTASNASFEQVETVIGGIVHEFEEAFGLEEADSGRSGQEYIDTIVELLDNAVAEYKEGNAQEAKALVIEAYLDNYEFIEADIAEDDPELMEKIEIDIREELVAMIDEGRPAAEVESHVNMIKADLETARAFVTSGEASESEESKGDSWFTINSLLGEVEKLTGKNTTATETALEKLEEARTKYNQVFAHEAEEHDPQTAQTIESAFASIEAGVESGTVLDVTLNKQIVDKLIYKIAFMKIEEELLESEVEEAAEWFTVMSRKFNYAQTPSEASDAMAELQADHSKIDDLAPVILDDLRATFLLKVKEEITEALEAQGKQPPDNANAQKFVIEGISYYRTIQPDVREKLGVEQEATLFHELEELFEHTVEGNLEAMQSEVEEINALLLAYEGKETTGIGAAISKMHDLLQLVTIEYSAAVSNGEIIDQEEYDETIVFLSQATDTFNQNKAELAQMAQAETDEVEADLASLKTMVEGMQDPSEVADTVAHAQHELEEILGATGGTVQEKDGWYYIDTVKSLLDQAVAEYEAGNYEEARTLTRNEAYLNNFEFIEPDIAEENPELMEKIEIAIREELVQMIDDRRPVDEIRAHVEEIKTELETARAVVTPEFPLTAGIVIASVAATILAGTYYNRRKEGGLSFF
ncbi:MAG TPA: hypothetical protein VF172_06325 [Nitrososphaera sp.]